LDEETSIIATWNKEEKKYKVQNYKQPLVESQNSANGEITSSLYKAMEQNGVKRGAINDFINLFSFDVDFQRDIRKGDSFDVGFSEYTNQEGNFVRSGNIRYAELSVQGIRKRYYKYKASSGRVDYYDSNGKSGRKALMKTPIEGARLSSSFGRRKHPVLGYTKIHKGTDFAAPRGTPIFAAGDGRIEYAGRNGSFGIYIRIRHNGSYKTAYAHMSGIAKGVRRGRSVRQGQVIGYVGTTGRSTGNHLHYEVYKNGRAINSRTMKLPSGKQLKGKELKEFKVFIKPMMRDGI
ncbi:MAG: peptidoglycan DD-metalloendopeptidase family protein, partial [Alphaproteobacteria bacterium]